jgi:hypothetical protein
MNFQDSLAYIQNARQRYLDFQPPSNVGGVSAGSGYNNPLPPLGQPDASTQEPDAPLPAPVIPQTPDWSNVSPAAPEPASSWGDPSRSRFYSLYQAIPFRLLRRRYGGRVEEMPGAPGVGQLPPLMQQSAWTSPQAFFPALIQTFLGQQNYDSARDAFRQRFPGLPPLGR